MRFVWFRSTGSWVGGVCKGKAWSIWGPGFRDLDLLRARAKHGNAEYGVPVARSSRDNASSAYRKRSSMTRRDSRFEKLNNCDIHPQCSDLIKTE